MKTPFIVGPTEFKFDGVTAPVQSELPAIVSEFHERSVAIRTRHAARFKKITEEANDEYRRLVAETKARILATEDET